MASIFLTFFSGVKIVCCWTPAITQQDLFSCHSLMAEFSLLIIIDQLYSGETAPILFLNSSDQYLFDGSSNFHVWDFIYLRKIFDEHLQWLVISSIWCLSVDLILLKTRMSDVIYYQNTFTNSFTLSNHARVVEA